MKENMMFISVALVIMGICLVSGESILYILITILLGVFVAWVKSLGSAENEEIELFQFDKGVVEKIDLNLDPYYDHESTDFYHHRELNNYPSDTNNYKSKSLKK